MNCLIFDIDGVITDIREKRVREEKIIDVIVQNLENNIPVIFITGRSLDWVGKIVLPFIFEKISNKEKLDELLILGEFGGDWIQFENGKEKINLERIELPTSLIKEAQERTDQYSSIMFTDKTKKTQFTSEVNDNVDLETDFKPAQSKLAQEYQKLVDKYDLNNEFEVHRDRLGTNIRSRRTNKSTAIRKALLWLNKNGEKVESFTVFGDGVTDLEMGEELYREKIKFTFVFVGNKEELPKDIPFPVHVTKEHFEKGTLEFLQTLQ